MPAVQWSFALEKFTEVAGLDVHVFARDDGGEGAGEGGLGRVRQAAQMVIYLLTDVVAGVVDGDAAIVFFGEVNGGEVLGSIVLLAV